MTELVEGWNSFPDFDRTETSVSWGVFDGVHRGHRRIIERTVEAGQEHDVQSLVISFDPHPVKVLAGEGPPAITPIRRRLELMAELGPDLVGLVPFDKKFASLSPTAFYQEILRDRLSARAICVGREARFGKDRAGDIETLKELVEEEQVSVYPCDHVQYRGERISSTRIRRAIEAGELDDAREMLGRDVTVSGTVVRGEGRGKEIGYPTANLELDHDVYPPRGIYGGIAVLEEGEKHPAVSSIGIRPTFEDEPVEIVEVHILDFDKDIYGQYLEFQFLHHIRGEEEFDTVEELIEQMDQDVEDFRTSDRFPASLSRGDEE